MTNNEKQERINAMLKARVPDNMIKRMERIDGNTLGAYKASYTKKTNSESRESQSKLGTYLKVTGVYLPGNLITKKLDEKQTKNLVDILDTVFSGQESQDNGNYSNNEVESNADTEEGYTVTSTNRTNNNIIKRSNYPSERSYKEAIKSVVRSHLLNGNDNEDVYKDPRLRNVSKGSLTAHIAILNRPGNL